MFGLERLFSKSAKQPDAPVKAEINQNIPTVKFDPSRVTDTVKTDLRNNIALIEGLDSTHFDFVYTAALRSISTGGGMASLSTALMGIEEMEEARAKSIASSLCKRAKKIIASERQLALGITHATWLYGNAPCMKNPKRPSEHDLRMDAAHRAANGKQFELARGMNIDGTLTWPGMEDGCKCMSKSALPF